MKGMNRIGYIKIENFGKQKQSTKKANYHKKI